MSGFAPQRCATLVVKIGSSLLVGAKGEVRRAWLETLCADIAERRAEGQHLVIVCSGSIALGARALGFAKGGRASLADAQAAASVGQIALARLWSDLLDRHSLTAAQILLTLGDLEDRRRYLNAAATLGRLLEAGAVPVVNENDSVATEEIRFGDNDRLAARVAQAAGADAVILLSDVDGLYDRNPHRHEDAELIAEVEAIDETILAMADAGSSSGMGSGGMTSKLAAAQIAANAGISLAMVSGRADHPLSRFAETGRGTVFRARRRTSARKNWLGGRLTSAGAIHVDAGAAGALRNGGSLLPAGAVRVEGDFARGDVVDIIGPTGAAVARGLAEYSAAETVRILGLQSSELEAALGYAPRGALVHRDHMALL